MASVLLAQFDYKYGAKDWRSEEVETLQKSKQTTTDYAVVDGQIVRTVETTYEFADAVAGIPARDKVITGPPYLFADGSYRKDPAFTFQKTHIKTSTFEAFGEGAYRVEIDDFDVLSGEHKFSTSIIDGKIPLAPTVKSALSNLVQQPLLGILDATCDYVDSKEPVTVLFAQDDREAGRVAKRRLQRANAIVRTVQLAANPLIRIGHTVRLIDDRRALDARHMVVGRSITRDENGAANERLEMEFWK